MKSSTLCVAVKYDDIVRTSVCVKHGEVGM